MHVLLKNFMVRTLLLRHMTTVPYTCYMALQLCIAQCMTQRTQRDGYRSAFTVYLTALEGTTLNFVTVTRSLLHRIYADCDTPHSRPNVKNAVPKINTVARVLVDKLAKRTEGGKGRYTMYIYRM
jgi:hypothetical protein